MISRRRILKNSACGFGALAAAALAHEDVKSAVNGAMQDSTTTIGLRPKAKRIIFIFMQGGVSQVDSFDHKPLLTARDGESRGFADARTIAKTGNRDSDQRIMGSPWKFAPRGQSAKTTSDLFPHISNRVDDLCFIHSMHTEGVAHGPATLFLHCGSTNFVRPSFGSWLMYALGSENKNLPGFVTIAPPIGNGGPRNYGNAFLDARFQGTQLGSLDKGPEFLKFPNLNANQQDLDARRTQLELLQRINSTQASHAASHDSRFDAVIQSYELAWRMQADAPQVLDLADETAETLEMYGIGSKPTDTFGLRCLLARRMCEAGVRFIQVNYGDNSANPAWDQHSNLEKHADHALATDKPVAGLLQDLKQRGLLEDTIVWWGSEFGRTPYAQENGTGRDHNPDGFTMWLAGAGVKSGFSYGATDDFGHRAIENKVHMHDLHATLLHLLGIDHEKLTFRHAGRDFRLTDVYGRVVNPIMA